MSKWTARPVGTFRADLGEGPLWDSENNRLVWVDIGLCRLNFTDPDTGETTERELPGSPGSVALTDGGEILLAIGQELVVLSNAGKLRTIARLPACSVGRFNDGAPDAKGRFWVGTATLEGHFDCGLWRYDAAHGFRQEVPHVSMSNGIGWSPDGRRMYYVDSLCHRVDALDFDAEAGVASDRRPFAALPDGQLPDGLCVDDAGCVWLAVWGQSCVICFSPDGGEVGRITLPTPLVTSCAFGGADFATLYVTTASEDDDDPYAGRLFAADVGARGLTVGRVRL